MERIIIIMPDKIEIKGKTRNRMAVLKGELKSSIKEKENREK